MAKDYANATPPARKTASERKFEVESVQIFTGGANALSSTLKEVHSTNLSDPTIRGTSPQVTISKTTQFKN